MVASSKKWLLKKRVIYFYLPLVLGTLAFWGTDLGLHPVLLDVLEIYTVILLFSCALCVLIDVLFFHAFDLTRWSANGMKEPR